jgi:hypothetical protein
MSFLGTVHASLQRLQLDPTGHVAGRIDLNCIDDQDAMRQAEMLVDTFGLELWEDDRMIAVFRKKKPN